MKARTGSRSIAAMAILGGLIPVMAKADDGRESVQQVFSRPVISRAYQGETWVLRDASGSGLRETPASVGAALALLRPSYVSGLIYTNKGQSITPAMVADYDLIRARVLAADPRAKFDIVISLNPASKNAFSDADDLLATMRTIDSQLQVDGWFFDFYSQAETAHPDMIASAVVYAHSHGQTIAGNVFDKMVPPGSDAVAVQDNVAPKSPFGYAFSAVELSALRKSSPETVLLGHFNNNPQNGPNSESCVYINQYDIQRRAEYLLYSATQQTGLGFHLMYPVFFPECPITYAFDPIRDRGLDGISFYDFLAGVMDLSIP